MTHPVAREIARPRVRPPSKRRLALAAGVAKAVVVTLFVIARVHAPDATMALFGRRGTAATPPKVLEDANPAPSVLPRRGITSSASTPFRASGWRSGGHSWTSNTPDSGGRV
jgi:hypothetical protein